ncbi:MAG: 4Fe-4S dicluster domain-containing protein [Prolixibacteraceae bacterium]|jgi:heterodisulfide reductase subunit C|nr:4Fe-4S dicluster domain-containing protein [Prolixibacteraceae bacterium]
MSEWGFTVIQTNQSDMDQMDRGLIAKIGNAEPSIFWCIGCGSCSATCTAAQFNNFSPRRIIQAIRSGQVKDIMGEVNKCLLCGKCQLVCPRHVNTRNILLNVKQIMGQDAI